MPELTLWKDQEIDKLRKEMDQLFSRMWTCLGISPLSDDWERNTSISMSETNDALVLKMSLPGISSEDLDISVTPDSLTIKCESREESMRVRDKNQAAETRISSFSRTFRLPFKVKTDDVKASYKKGTLKIEMPKEKTKKAGRVKIELK